MLLQIKTNRSLINLIRYFLFGFLISPLTIGFIQGQVTVGALHTPSADGALLELNQDVNGTNGETSNLGFALPRVGLTALNSLAPTVPGHTAGTANTNNIGLMVYNVTPSLMAGTYVWDGNIWAKLLTKSDASSDSWLTTGNAGTNPSTNFLGTTDNQALAFRVNNTRAGYISNTTTGVNSLGLNALAANTSGIFNTAIGANTLAANTTGSLNTGIGASALSKNDTGGNNTAIGALALNQNTGSNNTAVGTSSMTANTTGQFNTAVGVQALAANTTGISNTAMGRNALGANTTGQFNVAIGNASLALNQTPNDNTTLGYNTLGQNTSGVSNTAIGSSALDNLATGDRNTVIGYSAGSKLTSGSNNISIGANTDLPSNTDSNQMNIGNAIFGLNMTGTSAAPAGNMGIRTNNPTQPFHVNSLVGGVKTPIRLEGLPDAPSNISLRPLNIDDSGNVYLSQASSGGQILRIGISSVTYNNSNQESAIRMSQDGATGKAPNGANNYINTIQGSTITFNTAAPSGAGAPSRTTDRISLPPGVYQVTVRLVGAFSGAANDNTVFIKAIVDGNEYSLNNNVVTSAESDTVYFIDYINIEGTTPQLVDFTLQTKPGTQNSYTTQSSTRPTGSTGNSIRSMVLIQRLR